MRLTLSHQLTHRAVHFPGWLSWQCNITLSVTSFIILAVRPCVSHSFNDDRSQNSVNVLIDNSVDRLVLLAYNLKLLARMTAVSYFLSFEMFVPCYTIYSVDFCVVTKQPSTRGHMVDLELRICVCIDSSQLSMRCSQIQIKPSTGLFCWMCFKVLANCSEHTRWGPLWGQILWTGQVGVL